MKEAPRLPCIRMTAMPSRKIQIRIELSGFGLWSHSSAVFPPAILEGMAGMPCVIEPHCWRPQWLSSVCKLHKHPCSREPLISHNGCTKSSFPVYNTYSNYHWMYCISIQSPRAENWNRHTTESVLYNRHWKSVRFNPVSIYFWTGTSNNHS